MHPASLRRRLMELPGWIRPAPDSPAAREIQLGRSPWLPVLHLAWSVWVFLVPAFAGGSGGYTREWLLFTLGSYPVFLGLYALAVFGTRRSAWWAATGMAGLSFLLLPWYPSGLSYFVFGCVFLQPENRSIPRYVALLLALNAGLVACALHLGYPWQVLLWLPPVTLITGVLVLAERINQAREAVLRLSQEEVRRLARLAERERIGRDLHDLLGHTLSMVALKADLAARLVEGDVPAARQQMDDVARIAREALTGVRRAVSGIRAALLAAELASARLLLETAGITFEYRLDVELEGQPLAAEAETALALTVREAATNIHRHANARTARARLFRNGDEAVLEISDDGRGGRIVPGTGLSGMRERLQALGGCLQWSSEPGRGLHLQARLPLPGAAARQSAAGGCAGGNP